MEEILNALKKITIEMNDQKQEIRETGRIITEQVTLSMTRIFEEKFSLIEKHYENLKDRMENQEKKIQALERQTRKNNVVIFGIENNEETYESLERNVINWLEQYLSVKLNYADIQEVKKIGKKDERTRPIVVTLSTLGTKIKIMKQKRELKGTQYYIKEDYPKQILEKRRELQQQLQLERDKGNIAVIKYDRLIVWKNNSKRKLPTSPENPTITNIEKNIQINKKNKIQQKDVPAKPSNSLSEGVIKQGKLNFVINPTNKNNNKTNKHSNQAPPP